MGVAASAKSIAQTQEVITELTRKREELRAYVTEEGNDPPEILDWTWSRKSAGDA